MSSILVNKIKNYIQQNVSANLTLSIRLMDLR